MTSPPALYGRSWWDILRSGIGAVGNGIRAVARFLGTEVLELLGETLVRLLVFAVTRGVAAIARLLAN